MDIQVTQEKLLKALNSTSRIASAKAGLPVLGNVLLRTDNNRLQVAATNLEVASSTHIGAKVNKTGEITIPAKLINEFVSNLPNEAVDLTVKASKLHIACAGYKSIINGIDASEFPELPVIDEKTSIHFSITSDEFKQAAHQTVFACSGDVTRPVLTGVYWHTVDGWLHLAGTDGYRLAERRLLESKSELAAIVPASTIQEVLRIITDSTTEIDVLFDETQVRFRIDDTEVTSRLIDGKYPDYRQLIPASSETTAKLELAELSRTAKIARLFSRDTGGSIIIEVDSEAGEMNIKSVASEVGENTSTIKAEVSGEGSVSLNSRYLTEVLSVIDTKQLNISFSGKLAPIVLCPSEKDADYVHIIMPLKS